MKTSKEILSQNKRLRRDLLAWYDAQGRTLPWRIRPEDRAAGVIADPYKVWLSEIMCQQTTVVSAAPYWHKFIKKWSDVAQLAAAPLDDVLTAWAGLGYYARARNLHKCANTIMNEYGGVFPTSEAGLLILPGIGPYTAAAIACICFDEAATVVDGNVERVISRMRQVEEFLPAARRTLRALADELTDPARPGDYAQAIMDLGATICKPKNPKCRECPWSFACKAHLAGVAENYPKKAPKKERPNRYGAVFFLEDNGKIFLKRRPETGLLGGMMELPGTEWRHEPQALDIWMAQAPEPRNWQRVDRQVKHVFTHFTLYLDVFKGEGSVDQMGIWADLDMLDDHALPSVMMKAILHAHNAI